MVQGGLITAHPGGVHGDEGAPGGGSSFWQGPRAASLGSPNLETTVAAVQRGYREKDFDIRGFPPRGQYIGKGGHPGGPPGSQAPPWRGQPLGRATRALGSLVVALWPHFGSSGMFFCADFYIIFPEYFGTLSNGKT